MDMKKILCPMLRCRLHTLYSIDETANEPKDKYILEGT